MVTSSWLATHRVSLHFLSHFSCGVVPLSFLYLSFRYYSVNLFLKSTTTITWWQTCLSEFNDGSRRSSDEQRTLHNAVRWTTSMAHRLSRNSPVSDNKRLSRTKSGKPRGLLRWASALGLSDAKFQNSILGEPHCWISFHKPFLSPEP